MVENKELVEIYVSEKPTKICWDWANSVLYRVCAENPEHSNPNVIAGKMWLIGRAYAAQIERRSGAGVGGGDAVYASVAARIANSDLDERLKKLSNLTRVTEENLLSVLAIHKFLMGEIADCAGGEGRRSFCSKYLHFHKRDLFFIYDSRARSAIWKATKGERFKIPASWTEFDKEYAEFCLRCIRYRDGRRPDLNPRQLDDHLLGFRCLSDLDG